MSSHSLLAPSSAATWVYCPGSVLMSQAYPQESGEEAKEGTVAHWVAEQLTASMEPLDLVGSQHDGIVITEEIQEAAQIYAEDYLATMGETRSNNIISSLEHRVDCPLVHEDCYGTPDLWLYDPELHKLWLWDFKYGHGIVEAFENWQALTYLSGILVKLGIDGSQDQTLQIQVRIIQPRAYHIEGPIRIWELLGSDIRAYVNQLHTSAAEALGEKPSTRPGKYCRYCPGRHSCKALQQTALAALDYVGVPYPQELDPAARGLELRMLYKAEDAIKYRISGLETVSIEESKRGIETPGFIVEPTYGRKTWKDSAEEVIALGKSMGVDLAGKPATITPPQAIKAGLDPELVNQFTKQDKRGLKIVPNNSSTLASRVFTK